MKKVILSIIALLAFTAMYGQEEESKSVRLTAKFEQPFNAAAFQINPGVLEAVSDKPNAYDNPIAAYALRFLDTSIKGKKWRKVVQRPYYAHAFIAVYKPQ